MKFIADVSIHQNADILHKTRSGKATSLRYKSTYESPVSHPSAVCVWASPWPRRCLRPQRVRTQGSQMAPSERSHQCSMTMAGPVGSSQGTQLPHSAKSARLSGSHHLSSPQRRFPAHGLSWLYSALKA